MKFTFSVRKKTLKDYPLMERLDELFDGIKCVLPEGYGVVTASNWRHFPGLQFMLYSLRKRYDIPILVYDVGMTKEQLEWCEHVPGLIVAPDFNPGFKKLDYWEAWVKPLYIKNSPFKKSFWIDCDTVVTGELIEIIEESGDKPLFTADHTGVKEGTYNNETLYGMLPIEGLEKDCGEYLNTGVFLVDNQRDISLIDEWCNCVIAANKNPNIAKSITCWDQGACKWALQKLKLTDTINIAKSFNFPATSRQFAFPATPTAIGVLINTIRGAILDRVVVYHWMGHPKFWVNWGEILPIEIV